MEGVASHAGTTPMNRRRDAALAVAELALFMEQRAAADGDSVATIGQLQVPNGSINVVPGRCLFSTGHARTHRRTARRFRARRPASHGEPFVSAAGVVCRR
jgi:acetylornithine deacetylase/succinyl-diaminopimelate desuccinylase-like protein